MKPKVYYYSPSPSDSTAYYRTSGVFPFMDTQGKFELVDVSAQTSFGWHNMLGCQVFIMQRPFSEIHVRILQMIKSLLTVRIILDYDDDLMEVDFHNPTYQQYQASRNNIRECVLLADEVWVSTQSIADSLNHPNAVIVPNAHNDSLWKIKDKCTYNPNTRKIIYRGGTSHQADINHVAPSLIQVVNNNPNWMFQFLGDRYTYMELNCGDNYHIIPGFPIIEYFKYYYMENCNIAIFPLCDTKFNRGKSNIAWLEASMAGSAFFGNKELPEFNKSGILPLGELETLMKEDDLLKKANETSWEIIKDTLLLSKINKLRTKRIIANL